MVELHPAVKRLSSALTPMYDISGCPTTVAEVAVPVVLRWVAEQMDARAAEVGALPTANLGQSWDQHERVESAAGVAGWLRGQAAEVERDTRGGDRG